MVRDTESLMIFQLDGRHVLTVLKGGMNKATIIIIIIIILRKIFSHGVPGTVLIETLKTAWASCFLPPHSYSQLLITNC